MTHSPTRSGGPVQRRRNPLGGNPLRTFPSWLPGLLALALMLTLAGCERRQPASASAPAAHGLVQPKPGVMARQTYRNVPVLGELDSAEFDRTMQALTAWVAPQTGCSHCHVAGDDASDAKPAKATARRMLQMVQHLNNNWKPHVGNAGVTCQTCHQGQPRPAAGPADSGAKVSVGAGTQAVAAAGQRMLKDINGDFLAGGKPAACSSCHAASGAPAMALHEPARQFAALMLPPTEAAAPAVTALPAAPDTCAQAARAAVKAGTRLTTEEAQRPVLVSDALPLFSAPDAGCAMADLHLQVGDSVEAFVAHAGYTSVRYRRVATGSEARGWVRSESLGPPLARPARGPTAAVTTGVAGVAVAAAVPASCSRAAERPPAPEPLRGRARVLGQGRLQFFAVPDASCPLRGIFILPGEPVETLQRAAGFIAVAYVNPRTGGRATGWVAAARVGLTNDAQPTLLR